jgi:tripartite-type tricarboxylate transporter receptor subunit TctC
MGAVSAAAIAAPVTRAMGEAAWPSRPVTMIVPYPPGGQADLAARPAAAALEKIIGQPVIVENRGGGGGSIGNAAAARSAPDGYTLLMALPSVVFLPEADRLLGRTPAYELSQLAPVARVLADPAFLAVPAKSPWKTLAEFVEDAKKRPGEIPYGSSGTYGTLHVSMEIFTNAAGIKLLHVPFQGAGPAVKAILGGEVQAVTSATGVLKAHVDSGALRMLANFGANRIPQFPDVPTFKELGYADVEYYNWAGLFVPKGLPEPILTRLGEAMKKAMEQPETQKPYIAAGSPPAYLDAAGFQKFIDEDGTRLIAAVKKIGKVE